MPVNIGNRKTQFNTKTQMTIKVRQRKPKDGQIRLFLDIYDPEAKKKRTNKSLDLFLYEYPKTPAQKKTNKENLDAAEKIRANTTTTVNVRGAQIDTTKKK